MISLDLNSLLIYLQSLSPEIICVSNLLICYIFVIILFKYFDKSGLYIYISISIIASNLQILKAVEFKWYDEAIALGTIVYSTIFLASDILNEYYGKKYAKKSVYLSFLSILSLLSLMIPVLGIAPIVNNINESTKHFNEGHNALVTIFTPNLSILIASLTAYIISQISDILIFSKMKLLTKGNHLWFRTLIGIVIACLLDTVIFNILAWRVFANEMISWNNLIYNYMIGAYLIQISIAVLNIPVFYIIKSIIKK